MDAVRNSKGFTLIEILFAMMILPILFMSLYSSLDASNVIFRTNGVFSGLNQDVMQTLRTISREVGQTSPNVSPRHLTVAQDATNNSVVTFQIPVDCDNDGDVVDDEGTSCVQDENSDKDVEWGAYDEAGQTQNGRLNAWTRYFVVNGQLFREVLDTGLNPIGGLRRVVSNDVQSFNVTQNVEVLNMTLVLRATDNVGQMGGARNFQTTFTSQTVLRNAID